jgi:hypothetical protein
MAKQERREDDELWDKLLAGARRGAGLSGVEGAEEGVREQARRGMWRQARQGLIEALHDHGMATQDTYR